MSLLLGSYPIRMLELFASSLCGEPVGIELSNRALDRATVLERDRMLVLHKQRATLADIALGAMVLRRPCSRTGWLDGLLRGLQVKARWQLARQDLLARFPAIESALGPLTPRGIRLTQSHVRYAEALASQPPVVVDDASADFGGVGDTLLGSEVDQIIDLAGLGKVATKWLPQFPEVRYAHTRFAIGGSASSPDEQRALDERLGRGKELVQDTARCMREHDVTSYEETLRHEWSMSGLNVDPDMLPEVWLGHRFGYESPVFIEELEPERSRHDPSSHLVVFAVDMNPAQKGGLDNPQIVPGVVMTFARVYQELGYRVMMIGFWDRWVDSGHPQRPTYVCREFLIKDADDPFDDRALLRLHRAQQAVDVASSGAPAVFLPLHFHVLGQHLRRLASRGSYSSYHVCYFARRWSGDCLADIDPAERVCKAVEQEVEALKSSLGEQWRGVVILPKCVQDEVVSDSPLRGILVDF